MPAVQLNTARYIPHNEVCWSSTMRGDHMLSPQSAG